MFRLAILASHPIQYQAPWFRELARDPDLDVEVFFCHRQDGEGQAAAGFDRAFAWDLPLLDGYRYQWLTNTSTRPGVETFRGCDTPDVGRVLARGAFDACLVNGWYLKSYLQAVRACWRLGVPVLMRGDSQLATRRSPVLSAAKYWPYRWFLSRIDAHLYVGEANRAYLRHFGVPEERLFFAPHAVDHMRFARAADDARRSGAAARLRGAHGIAPDACVFLFAGKLIDRKRPTDLLDAVAQVRATGLDAHALVVGSGPLARGLVDHATRVGAHAHFVGFRNQTEMPTCYAAADCIVVPSNGQETWGLVVNEAMACGLPAIVSDQVGCGSDLVREGETGAIFPMGDVDALARTLARWADRLHNDRAGIAAAVGARIASYSLGEATVGLKRAISWACAPERSGDRSPVTTDPERNEGR